MTKVSSMFQVVFLNGSPKLLEIPSPTVRAGCVLVRVAHSTISSGTELTSMKGDERPLIQRVLDRPRKIKRALVLAAREGVSNGRRQLLSEYARIQAMGYSVAGRVVAVGQGVEHLRPGDAVACAGSQCAFHASVVCVPKNLCVPIPEGVSTADASTVALGAIALHGVRQIKPEFGATVGVCGLGFLGCLAAQFLDASGCRVVAWDLNEQRVRIAQDMGISKSYHSPPKELASQLDSVLITASSKNPAVLAQCSELCRRRGNLVILGDVPIQVERRHVYAKELELRMSTSYGPGRYDSNYEEQGYLYPPAYVPWTETRNMEIYLDSLAAGRVKLNGLSRTIAPATDAQQCYAALTQDRPPLLLQLDFSQGEATPIQQRLTRKAKVPREKLGLALVGTGNFVRAVHLPNLLKLEHLFEIQSVVSRQGLNAHSVATLAGAKSTVTEIGEVLSDPEIDAVLIGTRHDQHVELVCRSLQAKKHVLVEKPLALSWSGLEQLKHALLESETFLMTGFNRAFAPCVKSLKRFLSKRAGPAVIQYRMNAGKIPQDHWIHGFEGGGRNLGEACHIYHLFLHLLDQDVLSIQAIAGGKRQLSDNFLVNLHFSDGSLAQLCYTAEGGPGLGKERLEAFADGETAVLDDYQSLVLSGTLRWSGPQNKGHLELLREFGSAVKSGREPMNVSQQLEATRIALVVEEQLAGRAALADGL